MTVINWILSLLGKILGVFNNLTGNYLMAILIFALLFKIVLFPFSVKQQKNQVKQASLQPKIKAIQNKYKGRDDQASKQKMQQEQMDLYSAEGFNPMGGCFPLLLQFPILMAIYSIIRNPLMYICGVSSDAYNKVTEVLTNSFSYTGKDGLSALSAVRDNLSAVQEAVSAAAGDVDVSSFTSLTTADLPNFSLFGTSFDLSLQPTVTPSSSVEWWLLLIPLITFASIFLTTKLTRKLSYVEPDPSMNNGCSNWIMDLMMPAMSTYFTFMFPAIMGCYWIFNNLLGLGQTLLLRKMFPAPTFTEEDYKNAERAIRGKATKNSDPATDPRVVAGKKYKSLHHIDDDDPTELPVLPLDSRERDAEEETSALTEKEPPKLKSEEGRKKGKKSQKNSVEKNENTANIESTEEKEATDEKNETEEASGDAESPTDNEMKNEEK
jgi:YidC/Oxa1 family membrane protein insertase